MRYAYRFCARKEVKTPKHVYIFTGPCVITEEMVSVTVPAEELAEYERGALIQDAMRSLTSEEREFLISGIGPSGWEDME